MIGKILLFLVVLCFAWYILSAVALPATVLLVVALAGPLGLGLTTWLGRRALDRQPTPDNARWVTVAAHQVVMILLGSGIIAAIRLFQANPGWVIPLPRMFGLALIILSGLLLLVSTANLILSGLGMPIAFLPTRQIASDWLYSWTRNPIVLCALLFLLSLGLWMRSAWMMAWTILILLPVMILFLRVFEEREMEIRFGAEYFEYRARVPLLLPRLKARPGRNIIGTGQRGNPKDAH